MTALFARFGLSDRLHRYPDQLSGGQPQRVAIMPAPAMRPRIMLFDDIASALDPEMVGKVLDTLRALQGHGMTMMLATRAIDLARDLADRAAFVHDGRIVDTGPPEQVPGTPREARTRAILSRVL